MAKGRETYNSTVLKPLTGKDAWWLRDCRFTVPVEDRDGHMALVIPFSVFFLFRILPSIKVELIVMICEIIVSPFIMIVTLLDKLQFQCQL